MHKINIDNKMEKIGLFFGTYNPIHNGHLMMANYVLNHSDLDKIEFVVSPNASFKDNKKLVDFRERCKMIEIATIENSNISYNDCEVIFNEPTFTYDTISYLSSSDKRKEYSIIIGVDNFMEIETWHRYKDIIENFRIFVCPRNGINPFEKEKELRKRFNVKEIIFFNKSLECNLSSTFIRDEINKGNDISFYVPEKVKQYILKKNYYQCF